MEPLKVMLVEESTQPCGCDPGAGWQCDVYPYCKWGQYCYEHQTIASMDSPPPAKNSAAEWRKQRPITTGVLSYFPDALLEVAHCSYIGNEQHNPGSPLHWDRSKSQDEADALGRHLLERGKLDTDGVRHSAKVAWRALAMLQKEIEGER
jgi:hypothetical protein